MSDDLDITHGGAIAVDTEVLRDVGVRIAVVAERLADTQGSIRRAHGIIVDAPGLGAQLDTVALRASADRVDELQRRCEEASVGTLLMADAYELVELRAQAEALALTDAAAADALYARIEQLEASDDRVGGMADMLVAGWKDRRFEGLDSQFDLSGAMAHLFVGGGLIGSTLGLGKAHAGKTLIGKADPVTVRPVAASTPVGTPASLADAFRRFPEVPGAQIRVDRLTMGDGSTQFIAYIKGTQSPFFGAGEPWDMKSNIELYAGKTSASYQATLDALAAAGARPGDRVDLFAHSQAGMIASRLAMESEFEVQVVATAGSPTEPTLREDQLLVQLIHSDDIVSSLAGGGSPGGTGSPDSFTATREGDSSDGVQDVWADTHWMHSYIETAEMVDRSSDPRAVALDEYWKTLDAAEVIESTEYRAERTGWSG